MTKLPPRRRASSLIAGLTLLLPGLAFSQTAPAPAPAETSASSPAPVPIVIGERFVLASSVMAEDRPIVVYLPRGYRDGSRNRYPVLYLLDGEGHFHHATGVVDFLSSVGRAPEMIVVGVGNTDRTRDLTPPTADTAVRAVATGGADRFLRFLADELAPHIDSTYRTMPYRVLVGHSLGGLFALHTLTTRPDAFQAYVAISPSLWWDHQALVDAAPAFMASHPQLGAWLYMTTGNEGGDMLASTVRLAEVLRRTAPNGLDWTFRHLADESHGSIPHRTLYDGLEQLFAPMRMDADTVSRTVADLEHRYAGLSRRYRTPLPVSEQVINQFGYHLLGRELYPEAIAAFTVNTERHDESANTWDSLGDAYLAAGQRQDAIRSYERAVLLARRNGDPVLAISRGKLDRLRASAP